jgi:hypothetical protein
MKRPVYTSDTMSNHEVIFEDMKYYTVAAAVHCQDPPPLYGSFHQCHVIIEPRLMLQTAIPHVHIVLCTQNFPQCDKHKQRYVLEPEDEKCCVCTYSPTSQ